MIWAGPRRRRDSMEQQRRENGGYGVRGQEITSVVQEDLGCELWGILGTSPGPGG